MQCQTCFSSRPGVVGQSKTIYTRTCSLTCFGLSPHRLRRLICPRPRNPRSAESVTARDDTVTRPPIHSAVMVLLHHVGSIARRGFARRSFSSKQGQASGIPVIDVSPFRRIVNDEPTRPVSCSATPSLNCSPLHRDQLAVAKQLHQACCEVGFFYVSGHGCGFPHALAHVFTGP